MCPAIPTWYCTQRRNALCINHHKPQSAFRHQFVEEQSADPSRAAAFLDCASSEEFWDLFREVFSSSGPLSPDTGTLAYLKWKEWEQFIDGLDAATEVGSLDGIVVPLTGEWRPDGSGYFTEIREKRDWVKAMQQSQWQNLFGSPPQWSAGNLVGFMRCPVGFVMVQYVVFLVHKLRSNLSLDAAETNLESMLYSFVSILDAHFDHLESSTWNHSSFDLAVNLNLEDARYFPRYADFVAAQEKSPVHEPHWKDEWPEHAQWVHAVKGLIARKPQAFRIALVGEHGPSNLEHLQAAQAAAHDIWPNVPIEAGHFFTYLWQLDSLSDGSSLRSSLRITWDAFWGEPLTESAGRDKSKSQPLWTIDQAVWALTTYLHQEPFLRSSEIIVCSEPLWLCILLHASLGYDTQKLVTRASAAGRVMCLLVDFEQIFGIGEVDNYWAIVRQVRVALQGKRKPFTATSRITAEMLEWQADLRVPYVPFLSLHVEASGAKYAPAHGKDLLFFRSALPAQVPFLRVLRLIEAEKRARGEQLATVTAMTKPMAYSEIASFRAVAMLPHIPNALRLSDAYAMGIPVFVPDEPFIHKFVWPDDPLPLLSKARMTDGPVRHSPLHFQSEGRRYYKFREDRHYWLQYTEWRLRPHLLRFSALAWLLGRIECKSKLRLPRDF